mmetsp:Transcript_29251/g.33516  ORF Transcript_29251/g.33516 Transcript_29251/m.33516 type:complete len:95 (-) Transcript_29251:1050-1334(-)
MENTSQYIPIRNEENRAVPKRKRGHDSELVQLIFEGIDINLISETKHFDLSPPQADLQSDSHKKPSKEPIPLESWFKSLSLSERVLAVSTIFDK